MSVENSLEKIFNWLTEFNGIPLDLKNMTQSQLKHYHQKLVSLYVIDNRRLFQGLF